MTSNDNDQYRTEVTLVTKNACHLCDVAEQILIALGRTLPIRIAKEQITEGSELFDRVPVILIDNCIVSEGKIDLEAVRRAVVAQRLGTGASLLKINDKRQD